VGELRPEDDDQQAEWGRYLAGTRVTKHLPGEHDQDDHGNRDGKRSADQKEQLKSLHRYMEAFTKLRKPKTLKDWKYGSVEELLLDRGRTFSNEPYTPAEEDVILRLAAGVGPCHERECYLTALRGAMLAEGAEDMDIRYAEGLAMAKGLPIPINHAFLVLNGKPIDLTWRRDYLMGHGVRSAKHLLERARENLEDNTYIGIVMPYDFMRKRSLETGMAYPVLDDWEHGSPLLRDGIPEQWDELQKHLPGEHDQDSHGRRRHHTEGLDLDDPGDKAVSDMFEDMVDHLGHEQSSLSGVKFYDDPVKFVDELVEGEDASRIDAGQQPMTPDERDQLHTIGQRVSAYVDSNTGRICVGPVVKQVLQAMGTAPKDHAWGAEEIKAVQTLMHELTHTVAKHDGQDVVGFEEGLTELISQYEVTHFFKKQGYTLDWDHRSYSYAPQIRALMSLARLAVTGRHTARAPGSGKGEDEVLRKLWAWKREPDTEITPKILTDALRVPFDRLPTTYVEHFITKMNNTTVPSFISDIMSMSIDEDLGRLWKAAQEVRSEL
jgi:hypothetical protein